MQIGGLFLIGNNHLYEGIRNAYYEFIAFRLASSGTDGALGRRRSRCNLWKTLSDPSRHPEVLEMVAGVTPVLANGHPVRKVFEVTGLRLLLRPLDRLARAADADLAMLLRDRRDGRGFARLATVSKDDHDRLEFAVAVARLASSLPRGVDWISRDARTVLHWVNRPADCSFVLALARQANAPPFGTDAMAVVVEGCEWTEDVIDLWWSNQRSEARNVALRAALGAGTTGTILLDNSARVIELSRGARRLLNDNHGLLRQGDGLIAEHPDDALRLATAVWRVIAAAARGQSSAPEQFALARGAGLRPLLVAVMRPYNLPALHGDETDPAVMLLVVDPDAKYTGNAPACALYGLTGAETRLTEQLVGGADIGEAALAIGVTIDSARKYLKHIFVKTGVKRQAGLIRLMLNSQLPLRFSSEPGKRTLMAYEGLQGLSFLKRALNTDIKTVEQELARKALKRAEVDSDNSEAAPERQIDLVLDNPPHWPVRTSKRPLRNWLTRKA